MTRQQYLEAQPTDDSITYHANQDAISDTRPHQDACEDGTGG